VLVPVGKLIEGKEWVCIGAMPSVIRLQLLNDFDIAGVHITDLSVPAFERFFCIFGFGVETCVEGTLREDRELGSIGGGFPVGTIMRRNNLHRRSYKPLLKRAGLPNIRLYDLRHTFATLMFESSEQLKLVSEMLGHASVKQTADTYTHVSPTMHREAAMRLNDFLSEHLK
jgi:hypothetical protein